MRKSARAKSMTRRFLLLYGSQTGQAKAIAEQINEKCTEVGFQPDIQCMSGSDSKFSITKESIVVIVVSTTGDGEPPDTVIKFWRKLKKRSNPPDMLSSIQYALLGLGDSNYTNFCNMGKMMNEKLLQLGAKSFYEAGFADDGVGLEIVVEPWMEGLPSALKLLFDTSNKPSTPSLEDVPVTQWDPSTGTTKDGIVTQDSSSTGIVDTTDPVTSTTHTNITSTKGTTSATGTTSTSSTTGTTGTTSKTESTTGTTGVTTSTTGATTGITGAIGTTGVATGTAGKTGATTGTSGVTDSNLDPLITAMDDVVLAKSNDRKIFSEFEIVLRGDNDQTATSFTIPPLPAPYLDAHLTESTNESSSGVSATHSGSGHPLIMTRILHKSRLTSHDAQKTTLELGLSWNEDSHLIYDPGDALCVVCPNDPWEVQYIIERLNLSQQKHRHISISILEQTTKRNPVIPSHIPSTCTVLHYFTHCADIRAVLKKGTLSVLAQYCTDEVEKKRLQWLSSRQGFQDYSSLVLQNHLDLLDVLHAFPSCCPPLARLIECLPKLQHRYYSVASSPLVCSCEVNIVFNITVLSNRTWNDKERFGLCSGWLNAVSSVPLLPTEPVVPVFTRLKNPFCLPSDHLLPIVMIGPGTGLAPFIGFLEHRLALLRNGIRVGKSWLFFGCRHPDKDYLYKDRLKYYTSQDGGNILTHLHVSYSRAEDISDCPRYVQDNIRIHKEVLSTWIMEDNAVVFVCGDAKNMARNIKDAVTDVIRYYHTVKQGDLQDNCDAVKFIEELIEKQRYKVDQWI